MAEKKASKIGQLLSAGLTTVKWVGKGVMVLTVATVAVDAVQAGPTEAAKDFIKNATFYSVTVEPVGLWCNRTYKQAEEGKLNPNNPIGNYINNIRKFN